MVILNFKKIQEKGMYHAIRLPLHSSMHLFPYHWVPYFLSQRDREMYSDKRENIHGGEGRKKKRKKKKRKKVYINIIFNNKHCIDWLHVKIALIRICKSQLLDRGRTCHYARCISLLYTPSSHPPSVLDIFHIKAQWLTIPQHPDNSYCPMPDLKSSLNTITKKTQDS